MQEIIIKRPYMHFKGKLYYVHDILIDSETEEKIISYQQLYPPYEMYSRSLKMFKEEIDFNRKDNLMKQKHRFELFNGKII